MASFQKAWVPHMTHTGSSSWGPVRSSLLHPVPKFPSREVALFGQQCPPNPTLSLTLSWPYPSVPPLNFSPRAGEPLWAGWVTGEPPKSASVTAEAGKLPTLRVRPFWPFQVAVSGLWEEELVKEMGSGRKAAALRPHLPGGREAFFSPTQKGHCGPGRTPAGRVGLHQGAWRSGKTKRPTRPTFKELEKNKGARVVKKAGRTPPQGNA